MCSKQVPEEKKKEESVYSLQNFIGTLEEVSQ